MRRPRRASLVGLVAACLAGCGGTGPHAGKARQNGKLIAFSRESAGSPDQIVLIDADGVVRRTVDTARDRISGATDPAWSPDGKRLAFDGVKSSEAVSKIFVVDHAGKGRPTVVAVGAYPHWSPDGRQIGFQSLTSGRVGLVAAGGGEPRLFGDRFEKDDVAWSPDGRRIAFRSDRSRNDEIYVLGADGRPQRLTHDPLDEVNPTWSPDGRRIAFDVVGPTGVPDVEVMAADGSGRHRVADHGLFPAWSPDGTRIAFTRRIGTRDSISVMNSDGNGQHQVTDGPSDGAPVWSPDGTRILFPTSPTLGRADIYLVAADGSGLKQLTGGSARDFQPTWQPGG